MEWGGGFVGGGWGSVKGGAYSRRRRSFGQEADQAGD